MVEGCIIMHPEGPCPLGAARTVPRWGGGFEVRRVQTSVTARWAAYSFICPARRWAVRR